MNSGKCGYGHRIPFIECERGSGCITCGIREIHQIKITLQFSILSRSAVNANKDSLKFYFFAIDL
jgi:hypothetical protein